MRRADREDCLPDVELVAVPELRVLEREPALLHVVQVQPEEGEVRPVVPADQFGAHPLEVGEGHIDLDRLGPGHVRVGQDEAVLGQDDPGAYAGVDPAGPVLIVHLAHVDPHNGVEELLKSPAHRGHGRAREGAADDERGGGQD